MGKLIVSLSPHAHGTDSVERNMYGVIIALVPALLVSFVFFGIGSAVVCASSVASCVFFEWAITKYMLKREPTISDGSAILTGLLLGFNLPSNLPVWIVVIGALVAIGIGKMTFGGLGCNPFNPALVGRCFLLASFPAQMTSWPVAGQVASYVDAQTGATPLSIMKQAIKSGEASRLVVATSRQPRPEQWCRYHRRSVRFGIADRTGLHALEENNNMAHPGKHTCHGVRIQRSAAFGRSRLRQSRSDVAQRRPHAWCDLHGYRLCYFSHDA